MLKRVASILLCLCLLLASFVYYAGKDLSAEVDAYYSYDGVKTYTMKDATLHTTLSNYTETVSGTSYRTTGVQGMNVGTTYIYTAKIYTGSAGVDVCTIWRTDIDNKNTVRMNYYSSLSATSTSSCTTAGHANDLLVVTSNGTNYLLAATGNSDHAIARYKISGQNLYFTGYIKLQNTNGSKMGFAAVRQLKHTGGYFYLLLKTGEHFYYCRISDTDNGGSASNPSVYTAYHMAYLDKKNAVFALNNSSTTTMPTLKLGSVRDSLTTSLKKRSIPRILSLR